MIIRCLDTNKEAEARVVHLATPKSDSHIYGVAFVSSTFDMWDVEFPVLDGSGKGNKLLVA